MKLLSNAVAFMQPDEPPPPDFQMLTGLPLIIIVGLTGAGKSTLLSKLPKMGIKFTLLPNRREVTDQTIIASMQAEAGETPYMVTDRVKRFEYTARYREKFPGGMAYVLSRIAINTTHIKEAVFFDGLRGLDEVQYAVANFSQARFIVLDVSDETRLNRILKRGDAFDSTSIQTPPANQKESALMKLPNIETIFNEEQLRQIARRTEKAGISTAELIKKATIIIEDRRNYDPKTASHYLSNTLPEQALIIDSTNISPSEIAGRVAEWIVKMNQRVSE